MLLAGSLFVVSCLFFFNGTVPRCVLWPRGCTRDLCWSLRSRGACSEKYFGGTFAQTVPCRRYNTHSRQPSALGKLLYVFCNIGYVMMPCGVGSVTISML